MNAFAISHWFRLTFTNCVQATCFNALAHEIALNPVSTTLRQLLIVFSITDAIRVTGNQDQLNLWVCFHLLNYIGIENALTLFFEDVFIKPKQHFGLQGNLFKCRLSRAYWSCFWLRGWSW